MQCVAEAERSGRSQGELSMHLLDVTLFYSPTSGGVKRYLTAKHAWLAANAPSVRHTMLVPGPRTQLEAGGTSFVAGTPLPGLPDYHLPLNPLRWSRLIDALEPDLIEVGDAFHTAWAAARVARRRSIPLVAFYHSNLPELVRRRYGDVIGRGFARYVRATYERCDCVLAPSRVICDYLQSIGVAHTVLQPLGVDTEIFHPARRTRDLRAELGLPRDTRLLVYGGRLTGEKNVALLCEAFRRLGDPYALLLVGGDGTRHVGDNVRALPYVRDRVEFASVLASADALVHAGADETFGLVILEAMACGRPVVGMSAGAVPELVGRELGELARPRDAASLAEAIVALYDRDLEALGRAARARVLERFSWTRALTAQLSTYSSLLGMGLQPARSSANSVSFPLRSPTAT